jgi:hypothetical protein
VRPHVVTSGLASHQVWLAGRCLLAFAVAAGSHASAQSPAHTPDRTRVDVEAVAVPLNPRNLSVNTAGDFSYAGGLVLSSRQPNRLHELSDLVLTANDRITAVGDAGILLRARLILDADGRLTGLTDATIERLVDETGQPLAGEAADAEGLAFLRNGDLLVSFEKQPRILRYPSDDGLPRAMPSPRPTFRANAGMEALTTDPADSGVYHVGVEESGDIWTCRVDGSCTHSQTVRMPEGFSLVAMHRMPGNLTAYLLRAYDPGRGSRITLTIRRGATQVARMNLARPMTVDNFEGVTSVAKPDGSYRFYLISDDNGAVDQRTLLLAFDWRPR